MLSKFYMREFPPWCLLSLAWCKCTIGFLHSCGCGFPSSVIIPWQYWWRYANGPKDILRAPEAVCELPTAAFLHPGTGDENSVKRGPQYEPK